MTDHHDGYEVLPFPLMRRVVVDVGRINRRKPIIHGLREVDVTEAQRLIREHRDRTGEALSFTAFILTCLGRAVDANRRIHAYRNWRNQLIVFDDVDITSLIEVEAEGHKFPLAHIFRAANRRTLRSIHEEIRGVQSDPRAMQNTGGFDFMRWFLLLPPFVRDIFYAYLNSRPHLIKRHTGTIVLTAVGMFGQGGGWGIPIPTHNVNVTLGGIAEKPGVVEGQIEIRKYLAVTLSFNHDVVDGAPAARFSQRFKELIEGCHGLAEAMGAAEREPVRERVPE